MKAELSTERQAWIEDRASELIAEEYALKKPGPLNLSNAGPAR